MWQETGRSLRELSNKVRVKKVFHEGETHPQKPPTQIKTQFAQTISGQFVQTVPLDDPLKQAEKRQKSLRKLFVQNVFIWVGGFSGGSPSLECCLVFWILGGVCGLKKIREKLKGNN